MRKDSRFRSLRIPVTRRPFFVLAVAALAIGMICWVLLVNTSSGPATRAHYNRIRAGMTEADIEVILGAPGDKLGPLGYDDIIVEENPDAIVRSPLPHTIRCWVSDSHKIDVIFDGEEKAIAKYYSRPPGAGSLQRTIDWLGF
jgi:hypothetical protein